MHAALYRSFHGPIEITEVPDPTPQSDGVVLRVSATGVCRSDFHGWQGHDPDITLPHVPGHELAGVIEAVGSAVEGWTVGQRVTVPFVCGCGACQWCLAGEPQVCPRQQQPGFTHWGSFADYVEVRHAAANLVALPESIDDVTAASLGCRFTTAWRAVVQQGRVRAGEWLVVHGAGGVGQSAVMIGAAHGARVIAVDLLPEALQLARSLGAEFTVDASREDVVPAIHEATGGGAHVSLDALGSRVTASNSIACLRRQGRHVQVGILTGDDADHPVPMPLVIGRELEVVGSHGMAAHAFPPLLAMIERGTLDPARLVQRTVDLAEGAAFLARMDEAAQAGVTVIDMTLP